MIKSSIIYSASSIISAGIPFLLMPILTRYLTTSDYGVISMFQMHISAFGTILGFGSASALSRFYFEDKSKLGVNAFLSSCLLILLASAFFCALVTSMLQTAGVHNVIETKYVYIALSVASLSVLIQYRLTLWQVSERPVKYASLSTFQSLSTALIIFYFVIIQNKEAEGRILAQLLSVTFVGLMAFISMYREFGDLRLSGAPNKFYDILSFGGPLIPHSVGLFIIAFYDRNYIANHFGLDEVGVYAIAAQFALGLWIIFDALNKSWVPVLFSNLSKAKGNATKEANKKLYMLTIFAAALTLFWVSLIYIFGTMLVSEPYHGFKEFLLPLFLAQFFSGLNMLYGNILFFRKRTGIISSVTVSSAVVVILLTHIFPNYWGIMGVAYAVCVASLIRLLLTIMYCLRP